MMSHEDKFVSILAHIFGLTIIAPIAIMIASNNHLVKQECKRSLIFTVCGVVGFIAFLIVCSLIGIVTFGLFAKISGILIFLFQVVYFGLIALTCWNIWNNEDNPYPFVKAIEKMF